ncbi:MAG TPA: DUF1579 domain-containing protein [Chitinophagaceae bacterium]|nr:DUF1579 domain-containing protein [Chitinophagaceae bacterium]
MKRITLTICATAFLLASCSDDKKPDEAMNANATTSATTDSKTKEETWVPVDSATMMKNYMEYATPGEPHKMLAKSNGTWNGEVTMWMAPDAAPSTSKATMVNKMVMDGRYQVSETKGNMMGMPFNGMSTTGYDNSKKVFMSTWIDNFGTGIMKMEGPWNEATKSTTLTGKMIDPSTGRECDFKEIYTIIDDNNQKMEMYGPDPKTGKQFKTMEIKLTRKK